MDRQHANQIRETLMFALAGVIIAASGLMRWWHLIGQSEPSFVKAARAVVFVGGICVAASAFLARWRPRALSIAGLAAALLPILIVQYIVTRDARTMDMVNLQTHQAEWLIGTLEQTEDQPYVPWTEPTSTSTVPMRSNIYNVLDGFETVPVYSDAGWYISIVVGTCAFAVACVLYGAAMCRRAYGYRYLLAAVAAAAVIFFYAGPFAAYILWNKARAAGARGDYASAVYFDKLIPRCDPRWDDDMLYHADLGRMYARLGLVGQTDYWVFMADRLTNDREYRQAVQVYRDRLSAVSSRQIRARYVNSLIVLGVQEFQNQQVGEAADAWREAADLDPDNVEALYFEAYGMTKLGDYARAVPVWKDLISKNESVGLFRLKYFANQHYRKEITSRAWSLMGWCYFQLHDYSAAVHCRWNSMQAGKTDVSSMPGVDGQGAGADQQSESDPERS